MYDFKSGTGTVPKITGSGTRRTIFRNVSNGNRNSKCELKINDKPEPTYIYIYV